MARNKKWRGFTLIEILIVIAIIGILTTVVTINVMAAQAKGRYARVVTDMQTIATAIGLYKNEYKHWPLDAGGGMAPPISSGNPTPDPGWTIYINTWPTTPCGSDYIYDYENWPKDEANFNNPIGDPLNQGYIGVHFAYNGPTSSTIPYPIKYIYINDIYNFSKVTWASNASSNHLPGTNINDVSSKQITCTEAQN